MIVKQRADSDCVIACFAMLLEKPYEELLDYFPKKTATEGVSAWGMCLLLSGYLDMAFRRYTRSNRKIRMNKFLFSPFSKPGIWILTGLEINHAVFFNGRHVIDPNGGKIVDTAKCYNKMYSFIIKS